MLEHERPGPMPGRGAFQFTRKRVSGLWVDIEGEGVVVQQLNVVHDVVDVDLDSASVVQTVDVDVHQVSRRRSARRQQSQPDKWREQESLHRFTSFRLRRNDLTPEVSSPL